MMQSVWITGIGAITPLGHSFGAFADQLLAGRSAVGLRQLFPEHDAQQQLAASVDEYPTSCESRFSHADQSDLLTRLAWNGAVAALQDAALWEPQAENRIGLVLGLGAEWLRIWEIDGQTGGRRVYQASGDRQSMVQRISQEARLSGPTMSIAAACASGNYAIWQARQWIRNGLVDVCLAGGCDLVTPMAYAGFNNLRALSRREGDPTTASRPFDLQRDGFVMGEGAAILVLESERHARRRGADCYAEVAGFGATSDASHMIIPSTDPAPAAAAMQQALRDAAIEPAQVDYINAHATSTPVGDRAEVNSLRLAMGEAIEHIPVSSTKSMTGHLLSAAAAVEAVACLAAIQRQAVPPTINLDEPDPDCILCHVPHEAREQPVRVAMSNSFGFGGSNTCLILRSAA